MSVYSKLVTISENYWNYARWFLLSRLKERQMWSTQMLLGVVVTFLGGAATLLLLLLRRFPWIKYDWQTLWPLIKVLIQLKSHERKRHLIVDQFESKAKTCGSKTFLIFEGVEYSYEYVNEQANKVANAAISLGLQSGTTVALLINNEPTFVWTYLGLSKVGIRMAFLNFNLRAKSLFHCFAVSGAKTLFVGKHNELSQAVEEIYTDLKESNVTVYIWDENANIPPNFNSFQTLFNEASSDPISRSLRSGIKFSDPVCYIYTSGTTGLPKAAIISQSRAWKGALLMRLLGVGSKDVLYTPLPLYHSAGGVIALGATICEGATLVLRNKFSATHFFADCARHNVTVIQYIGELCRYLLARPPSPTDKSHCVRVAFGNGLRRDIWAEFMNRFNIPVIGEFYAATEGTTGFINLVNKQGAVGRASPFMKALLPTHFVKYNFETGEPLRNEHGLCTLSETDETGLMVTPIKRNMEFDGYKGHKELNEKKVLRDVFKLGDIYFNSGDLFNIDKDYFVYFADRIGDTFRWKGENVSTVEVSNTVSELSWIEDANVYGVDVPGQDGRAGMAAITPVKQHQITPANMSELFQHCSHSLPLYAIPRFLRIQTEMEITSTFKQRKVELVKEAFDPSKVKNCDLYYVNTSAKSYELITPEVYKSISVGKIRL